MARQSFYYILKILIPTYHTYKDIGSARIKRRQPDIF